VFGVRYGAMCRVEGDVQRRIDADYAYFQISTYSLFVKSQELLAFLDNLKSVKGFAKQG
jgi:hypothetical protein